MQADSSSLYHDLFPFLLRARFYSSQSRFYPIRPWPRHLTGSEYTNRYQGRFCFRAWRRGDRQLSAGYGLIKPHPHPEIRPIDVGRYFE